MQCHMPSVLETKNVYDGSMQVFPLWLSSTEALQALCQYSNTRTVEFSIWRLSDCISDFLHLTLLHMTPNVSQKQARRPVQMQRAGKNHTNTVYSNPSLSVAPLSNTRGQKSARKKNDMCL